MKPDIFDFIEKHNLHDSIREKVKLCLEQRKHGLLFRVSAVVFIVLLLGIF